MNEELQQLLNEDLKLKEEIVSIKIQIEEAKANVHSTGQYSDPNWYAKANAACRIKGIQLQRIQRKIGLLSKKLKQEQGKTDERLFVQAAQVLLDKSTYLRIWDQVEIFKKESV